MLFLGGYTHTPRYGHSGGGMCRIFFDYVVLSFPRVMLLLLLTIENNNSNNTVSSFPPFHFLCKLFDP